MWKYWIKFPHVIFQSGIVVYSILERSLCDPCSSLCVQAGPAVCLPPGLPAAQPGAAVPAQPHSGSAQPPLPGLQLRLQPLRPHCPGAVPLHPFPIAVLWLPQLQLLPQHSGARSLRGLPDPSRWRPPSSGHAHCHARRPAGLPPLPSAPARPHAVSGATRCWSSELMCQNWMTVDVWHHQDETLYGGCDVIKRAFREHSPPTFSIVKICDNMFFCYCHQHTIWMSFVLRQGLERDN